MSRHATALVLGLLFGSIAPSLASEPAADLRAELEAMLERDQRHRGGDQDWDEQTRLDRDNLARLDAIVERHGWPKLSEVGEEASRAAFLVVQHADLEAQLRYLPMMAAARDAGELAVDLMAMLEDRIRMREGKPQVYGTQIVRDPETGGWVLHPLDDPENIDEIRAAVGLGPIAEYLERFGIEWAP